MYNFITFNALDNGCIAKTLTIIFPNHLNIEFIESQMLKCKNMMSYKLETESFGAWDSSKEIELGYKPKYIVFETCDEDDNVTVFPFIFSNDFTHDDVRRLMMRCEEIREHFSDVYGAGFIYGSIDNITCYGNSESIGVESNKCDTDYIKNVNGTWIHKAKSIEPFIEIDVVEPIKTKPVTHKLNTVTKSTGGIILQGKKGKRWS